METIRQDEHVARITKTEWLGREFNPEKYNEHGAVRLNTYVVESIEEYIRQEITDTSLFGDYKSDYAKWTLADFTTLDRILLNRLKRFLRDNGVYVEESGSVAKQLFTLAQHNECPVWPEAKACAYAAERGAKFKSVLGPKLLKSQVPAKTAAAVSNETKCSPRQR